jgi:hypothetical protein
MITLRARIDHGHLRLLDPLPPGSDGAEAVVLLERPAVPLESLALMRLQEQTGLVQALLAAESEAVWNDLRPVPGVPQDR